MKSVIRIGTRGSQLALYQAHLVKTKIEGDFPFLRIEIVKIKTGGDMVRRGGQAPFETKRIYTREIEEALLANEVDLAVHSAKDMSVTLPEGLGIGAVMKREDPRDCLVSKDKRTLAELPLGSRVGTSSLRRKAQLLRRNPELIVEEIHGNVDSRIRKLEEGVYDAIVLAYAGLKRLGLVKHVTEIFGDDYFYPAPGQGTIAVQSREADFETGEILKPLHHGPTARQLECERAFLRRLEGGCQLPCGIATAVDRETITASGALFAVAERQWVEDKCTGTSEEPAAVGKQLADQILDKGGREILESIRAVSLRKKP